MELEKYTWFNGEIIDSEKANIPVGCKWTQYGTGCFEGIRCYPSPKGPAVFRLKDHLQRFHFSLKTLGINPHYSVSELTEAVKLTIKENQKEECYIRPCAGYISQKIGLHANQQDKVGYYIQIWDWPAYFSKPVRAKISPFIRPHPKSLVMESKICGMYINSFLTELEAEDDEHNGAILLDYQDFAAEAPTSNLFMVTQNGSIFTPRKGSILPGITRDTVIQICKDLKYPIFELNVGLIDLYQATEVFVCGTAAEITPVVCIDYGNPIEKPLNIVGDGKIGPITAKLQKLYKKIVTGQESKYEHWLEYV